MDDVIDDAKGEFRRIELLTGPAGRRRWSEAEKARIVAETLVPGAVVSAIARRWQVCPQQIFGWRRAVRAGDVALVTKPEGPAFVPIVGATACPMVTEAVPPTSAMTAPPAAPSAPAIEVTLAGAVVRVASGTDGGLLTTVLRAVRASAT
ncbi:MAG: transposase [Proteobacteria bacterium]|nr:transposase [Pseudomonadota bacterium]